MKVTVPLSWESVDGLYRVRIARRCVQRMQRLAAAHAPDEVGTPLIGHYSSDGHVAFVASLAPLPPDSQHGRYSFIRGVAGLADFLQRVRRRFRGQRYRVGEWHSHPEASPRASGTDDANQTSLARDQHEGLPEAILIILGGNALQRPSLGVYVYSRKRGRVLLRPST